VPGDPFGMVGPIEFYTDALSYHSQWYPSEVAPVQAARRTDAQLDRRVASERTRLPSPSTDSGPRFQASWKATLAENELDAVAMLVSLADPPARSNPQLASPRDQPRELEAAHVPVQLPRLFRS